MNSFETSVLRVMKGNSVVGAAFLVSDHLVATCAHVIELAGTDDRKMISLRWGDEREIDAFVDSEFWRPSNAEDFAILRLEKKLEELQPLSLGSSLDTRGHSFTTFGFPESTQEVTGGGKIIGHAKINGTRVLQLRSPEITSGFSGAPIFDEITKQVVGMVVAIAPPDKYQRLGATAFAIPSESINDICPKLKISQLSSTSKYTGPLHQLPPPPWDFVGRENELNAIVQNIDSGRVILGIKGIAGVGKTSIGLKLSEMIEEKFSDGQIFLDMRGSHDGQPLTSREAMIHVIKSFHPEIDCPDTDSALEALYRSTLHGNKVLLFFDNIYDTNQVISLIPPKSCFMILTSRQHFDLPGLLLLNLNIFAPTESCLMIQSLSGNKLTDEESIIISEQCGHLPLAIRISINLLGVRPDWTPKDLIAKLVKQKHTILDSVAAAMYLSYQSLGEKLQKRFRHMYIASLIFSSQQEILKADTNVSSIVSLFNSKELPKSLGLISMGDVFDVWKWGDNTLKFLLHYFLNSISHIAVFLLEISLKLVVFPIRVFTEFREERRYFLLILTSLPLLILGILIGIIFIPAILISLLVIYISLSTSSKERNSAKEDENWIAEFDDQLGALLSTGLVEYYGPYVGIYGRGLRQYELLKLHDLTILFVERKSKQSMFERILMRRAVVTTLNRLTSLGDIFDSSPSLRFPGFG